MSFAHPDLLVLVLLAPAAALAAAWLWRRRLRATEAWAARPLWDRLLTGYSRHRLLASVSLLVLAVLGAAAALAQPRWGRSQETVKRKGVDVVLVLDASLSMGAHDVSPSRMAVAKILVRRLVQAMPGNRVALVGAEGDGLVLSPLTTDAAVLDLLLDGLAPGSLPTPGTELGNALDQVLQLFPPGGKTHRAAILISDGEDHGGGLANRLTALSEAGVAVHTIGVGTPAGAPVPVPGQPGANKRREDGSLVISRLHEEVLEQIARATGGVYLRATDPARDLSPIVRAIDGLEKSTIESTVVATRAERFQWPLGTAVAALALFLAVPPFQPTSGRRPGDGRSGPSREDRR